MTEDKTEAYCSTDINNAKLRVKSPHTREAIKQLGIDQSILAPISFKQFIQRNPSVKEFTISLQKNRYQHSQDKRQMRIQLILSKRDELMKEDLQALFKSKSVNKFFMTASTTSTFKSSFNILEKMRLKQERELSNMMEYEISNEDCRQKIQLKLLHHKEKEENFKRRKQLKLEMESKRKELKEKDKEKNRKEEENAKRREKKEKELKEKQKLIEEGVKQNDELQRKTDIRLYKDRKRAKAKEKIKDKQLQDQFLLIQKENNLKEKDKSKQKAYQTKQQEELDKLLNKKDKLQKKINKALSYNEQKINDKNTSYEAKQKQLLQLTIQASKEKEIESLIHQMELKKKEEKGKLVLAKFLENEQRRIKDISMKIEALSQRQKDKEEYAKLEQFWQKKHKEQKEKKLLESKLTNDIRDRKRIDSLVKRFESVDEKMQRQKEESLFQTQMRLHSKALMREDRNESIQMIMNQKEYAREKKSEVIAERMRRVEEMQKEKEFIVQEKMKIQEGIRLKKGRMMDTFAKLLQNDKVMSKEEFYKELFGKGKRMDSTRAAFEEDRQLLSLKEEKLSQVEDLIHNLNGDKNNEKDEIEHNEGLSENTDFIPVKDEKGEGQEGNEVFINKEDDDKEKEGINEINGQISEKIDEEEDKEIKKEEITHKNKDKEDQIQKEMNEEQ